MAVAPGCGCRKSGAWTTSTRCSTPKNRRNGKRGSDRYGNDAMKGQVGLIKIFLLGIGGLLAGAAMFAAAIYVQESLVAQAPCSGFSLSPCFNQWGDVAGYLAFTGGLAILAGVVVVLIGLTMGLLRLIRR